MYLGELSPIQESQLVQLKSWVSELLKGKVPSDPILLRFLRARDFNVEKAREMLSQSLIWRKKHGVDKILSEYELPPVVNDYFPGGMFFYTIIKIVFSLFHPFLVLSAQDSAIWPLFRNSIFEPPSLPRVLRSTVCKLQIGF